MRVIREHQGKEGHQKAIQLEEIAYAKLMDTMIAEEVQAKINKNNQVTVDIIRLVYFSAKNYMSFSSHPRFIELFEATNVDMGKSCHTRKDAEKIAAFISDVIHSDFCNEFNREQTPVYLILDGSEDRNHNHEVVLVIQHLGIFLTFTSFKSTWVLYCIWCICYIRSNRFSEKQNNVHSNIKKVKLFKTKVLSSNIAGTVRIINERDK